MFDKTRGGLDAPPDAAESASSPPAPGVLRFEACRWRKPADGSLPAHCGHREVISLAGTHGFNPEAWCGDCRFYKLRRTARKSECFG